MISQTARGPLLTDKVRFENIEAWALSSFWKFEIHIGYPKKVTSILWLVTAVYYSTAVQLYTWFATIDNKPKLELNSTVVLEYTVVYHRSKERSKSHNLIIQINTVQDGRLIWETLIMTRCTKFSSIYPCVHYSEGGLARKGHWKCRIIITSSFFLV
jgi:hypothetical protein